MTSKNSSFSDRISNYRKYVTRTLWTSIVALVLLCIYYMAGTIIMISRSINYAQIYHQSAYVLQQAKYNAVGRVMGFEQLGFAITFFIAVAFAFQGFSYLFDQRKLDFYLSQPTTRARRLWKNYFRAFLTFLLMYVPVMAVSLMIVAAMGAVNEVVLATALAEMVRNIIFFFAVYNITLLAILLTGTLPIAVLVLLYMLAVSWIAGFLLYLFESAFYSTFSYYEAAQIWASPVYDRISVFDHLKQLADMNGYYNDFAGFSKSFHAVLSGTIDTMITGIVVLVFVVIFSRRRRAEHAGHTIVYRPFRWFVKVSVCVLVSLSAGYIVYSLYDYVWTDKFFPMLLVVMLLTTILCGCIVEAIMESNIRKLFDGKFQTIMALALVVLIYVVFKGDLLGYDSYIPDASKVESCAFANGDYSCMVNYEYIDENSDHMEITDVETFIKIAEIGMKTQRELAKGQNGGRYVDLGWSDTNILYRLKDGRQVYRKITIPYNIDTRLMSKLIDSKEYKEGYFAVFYDDELRKFDEDAYSRTVRYNSSSGEKETSSMPYSELSDAYRKDILGHYNFTLANNELPIGSISYSANIPDPDGNQANYVAYDLKVYSNFENTIALLRKYGIYSEHTLDVEYIESVCITNYYPGYDITKMDWDEINELQVESVSEYYEDKKQIREILDSSYGSGFYGNWFDYRGKFNDQYGIEFKIRNAHDQYSNTSVYYNFMLGKVPDFVVKDTN